MAPRKGSKRKEHGYTLQDLIDILDKVIPLYKASDVISFHTVLQEHCTYHQTNWDTYLHEKKQPEIIERFNILRDIQEQKVINGAISGRLNPAFSMFFLKCKRKWVEQQHIDRLELDKKKQENDSSVTNVLINKVIEIGFGSEDETED